MYHTVHYQQAMATPAGAASMMLRKAPWELTPLAREAHAPGLSTGGDRNAPGGGQRRGTRRAHRRYRASRSARPGWTAVRFLWRAGNRGLSLLSLFGTGGKGWRLHQSSDQAQQRVLFRPISAAQKLAQLDVRQS